MCLDTISSKKPKESGYGYKVYYMPYWRKYCYIKGTPIVQNKWHTAEPLFPSTYNDYTPDFHIFKELKGALRYLKKDKHCLSYRCIVKVQYKGAHTLGRQWKEDVIVAKQMRIIKRLYEDIFSSKGKRLIKRERK